jgi:transcriptional regulator with XRE-family HTH domain
LSEWITPTQCRKARKLLTWSRFDLGRESGLTAMMIAAAERGLRIPHEATAKTLRRAFEAAGVEFTNGKEPSVRMKAK